jgi:hypothetical protein
VALQVLIAVLDVNQSSELAAEAAAQVLQRSGLALPLSSVHRLVHQQQQHRLQRKRFPRMLHVVAQMAVLLAWVRASGIAAPSMDGVGALQPTADRPPARLASETVKEVLAHLAPLRLPAPYGQPPRLPLLTLSLSYSA